MKKKDWLCSLSMQPVLIVFIFNPADYFLRFHTSCLFVCLFVWYLWIESSLHLGFVPFWNFLWCNCKADVKQPTFRVCAPFWNFLQSKLQSWCLSLLQIKFLLKSWFPFLICFGNSLWNECVQQAPHYIQVIVLAYCLCYFMMKVAVVWHFVSDSH